MLARATFVLFAEVVDLRASGFTGGVRVEIVNPFQICSV